MVIGRDDDLAVTLEQALLDTADHMFFRVTLLMLLPFMQDLGC